MHLLSLVVAVGCCVLASKQSTRHRGDTSSDIKKKTPNQHHFTIEAMSANGEHMSVIEYLENLMKHVEHLNFDDRLPSLYSYLGIAYHDASRSLDAVDAFKNCSRYHLRYPDPRCWMNEAEASMFIFRLTDAVQTLEKAVAVGYTPAYSKLLRAKGWTNNWKNFEEIGHNITTMLHACINAVEDGIITGCDIESGPALEYVDPSHLMMRYNAILSPSVQPRDHIAPTMRAQLWTTPHTRHANTRQRLKVGLLSSDFGVHPVATLIRGFVQFVDTSKIELYCFALTDKRSWWGINISKTAEHFINLASTNTVDAAMEVALEKIDILIDLNGGTLNSGLGLMGHKPSPVQISYLGFPSSTGASYIDYYLADHVALPAEGRTQFVEKLALIPTSSIVNDYAQLRGGLLEYNYDHRVSRDLLHADVPLNDATFLFSTLSNFQKICPSIFHTWMNILNRMPGSKMVLIAYSGSSEAIQNLRKYSPLFGNQAGRLAYAEKIPWVYHLQSKTALDMILDTRLKNGHTTGLDGLWAGVPTVTLGGMADMGKRCGESFAAGLDLYTGLAFSLKEYEDIAIDYARHPDKLKTWRNSLGRKRVTESLFDLKYQTRNLERMLESMWELTHISELTGKKYNVVNLPSRGPPSIIETHEVDGENVDISTRRPRVIPRTYPRPSSPYNTSEPAANRDRASEADRTSSCYTKNNSQPNDQVRSMSYAPLPLNLFDNTPLMLNLGGNQQHSGWINVHVQSLSPGHDGHVAEVVRDVGDLYGIPDNTVDALYCSHALEHMKIAQLEATLDEWSRVLKPGGVLFLSVPDLKVMARLLLDDDLDANARFFTMKMIYGAQSDEFDFHHIGFDDVTLPALLAAHKFCNLERVANFNIFHDLSTSNYHGRDISLNVVARKCGAVAGEEAPLLRDISSTPFLSPEMK